MSGNAGVVDFFEVHFERCRCDPKVQDHGYLRCDSLEGSLLLIAIVSVAHGEAVLRAVGCDDANTVRIKSEMQAEGLPEVLVSDEEDRFVGTKAVQSLLQERVFLLLDMVFGDD